MVILKDAKLPENIQDQKLTDHSECSKKSGHQIKSKL
jgi:hypothetical protein